MILIQLRTGRGQNDREHWRVRAKRVKAEKESVGWALRTSAKPELPCIATLTRVAPSNGLDDDNLSGSLKAPRDAIAEWLRVDDKFVSLVEYRYAQRRGREWGVEIDFQQKEKS